MAQPLNYKVEPKENIYFAICLVLSLLIYTGIVLGMIAAVEYGEESYLFMFAIYAILFLVLTHMMRGVLVGLIRGNAVKLGPHQFPDIHSIVMRQAQALGLTRIPDVYLLQAGGSLNAFATRFMGADYIVLFSDIMDEAYEENLETVEFVIAHELGHVKRNHILKRLIVLPSIFIPFLGNAYSRACEYTCDSIGASLSEKGARSGLLVLAAGTKLFRKVDMHQFVEQTYTESGFWMWFSEKTSSHPHLVKRLQRFPDKEVTNREAAAIQAQSWNVPTSADSTIQPESDSAEQQPEDPGRFMPR